MDSAMGKEWRQFWQTRIDRWWLLANDHRHVPLTTLIGAAGSTIAAVFTVLTFVVDHSAPSVQPMFANALHLTNETATIEGRELVISWLANAFYGDAIVHRAELILFNSQGNEVSRTSDTRRNFSVAANDTVAGMFRVPISDIKVGALCLTTSDKHYDRRVDVGLRSFEVTPSSKSGTFTVRQITPDDRILIDGKKICSDR